MRRGDIWSPIEHEKRWGEGLRLRRKAGADRAIIGYHHLHWTAHRVRRREDIDLRRTDVVHIRVLAVHRRADLIQLRRHLTGHEVRALPDARIAGGREVNALD